MNEFINEAKVRVPNFEEGTTANEIVKLLLVKPRGRKEILDQCTKLGCEKHSTRGRISELRSLGIIQEEMKLNPKFLKIFKSKNPKKQFLKFIKNKLREARHEK